jgi:release factor glutamine methyltransferase
MTPGADSPPELALSRAELLRTGATALASAGVDERDAAMLLAHSLGVTRTQLMMELDTLVTAAARALYGRLITRRAAGEPTAYLMGKREFWSLPLAVTPAVLVPRPETELLVERALALCATSAAHILDLGTGSGAVALALASERPSWHVTATDRSPDALAVAQSNAARLQLTNVACYVSDWFGALGGRRFALIVSNPPYVAADDAALLADGVRFEPRAALVAGADGLDALRSIVAATPAHLESGGALALEHGATQGLAVRELLVAQGFHHVRSHRDFAGHERVTEGRWPTRPLAPSTS